jgi:hypothetical protein
MERSISERERRSTGCRGGDVGSASVVIEGEVEFEDVDAGLAEHPE